jgi:ADP-heptose:LPS heptosyltransferase
VGFVSVTSHNGINTVDRKANRQKIVIHPTSSRTQKNWPTDKYIRLATLLKEQDYEPIFTVSPAEREQWLEHTQGNFQVPYFQNLSVLAEFYQDARLFIGNDSGNAHLASYVGVPTVQIFKRYRRNPAWRAGWSDSRVIIAKIPYCFYSNDWAKGISVVRVLTAVRDQLALDQLNRTDYAN